MGTLLEVGLSNAVVAVILAVFVGILARVCRRPALTHSLWLLVLLKLVTPPLFRVPVPWLPATEVPASANYSAAEELTASPWQAEPPEPDQERTKALEPSHPVDLTAPAWRLVPLEPPADIQPFVASAARSLNWTDFSAWLPPAWVQMIGWFWMTTSLLWFACTGLQVYRFHRLLGFAKPAPPALQDEVVTLAARLGLSRYPRIWLVPGAVSPMLWSVGRIPRLLFPAKLLEQLDRKQRATLFVHELAHYRRRDHWVRLVEVVVLALYWWHPLVWWARRELREAEEQCCDAWVVWALAGADRAYATALLQTVAFFSRARCGLPAAASGIGQVRHLRRRLTMIMQSRTPRSLSWAGVLAVLALGLFLLPLLPALAQDDNKQGDGTDRKIEELKKQLQALEEQKQADKKKSEAENKLRQAADVKKARHEVEALAKELQAKRGELQKLEERHNAALARLAELEGTHTRGYTFSPDGKTTYQFVRDGKITYQFGPNGSEGIWYAPDAAKRVTENTWKTYTVPSEGKPIEVFFTTTPSKPDQKSQKSGRTAQHGAADKSADLERKLDRLSKELEELRRELKQNRGNGGN